MSITKPIKIPTNPGIYFFKNPKGKILYIGKAGNLKNRLSSYFNRQKKEPRIESMLEEANRVEWQETDSEIEAFLLEAKQIKRYLPKYNIALRDGKQYSYVVFTDDPFPKIFITHPPSTYDQNQKLKIHGRAGKNQNLVGPFVESGTLRATLKMFRRIFPYCTCNRLHNNYCLNYHIGLCLGFCCLKNSNLRIMNNELQMYLQNVKAIKDMLNGRKKALINQLEKEMKATGNQGNFEQAIVLRNKLEKIKRVFENARVIKELVKKQSILYEFKKIFKLARLPERIEGYDISNIQGKFATGSMVVFTDGNPDKNEYRKFKVRRTLPAEVLTKTKEGTSNKEKFGDTKMLEEVLTRRFQHLEWHLPDLIIVDGGKGQLNAAKVAISNFQPALSSGRFSISKAISIIALTKNAKHRGDHIYLSSEKLPIPLSRLPESVKNLILHVDSEAHRFAIEYYRKLHRKYV